MAYIKIDTIQPVYDGMPLTFEAPCDCTATEGLTVGTQNFVFRDVHGNTLTGVGNLFLTGALVKVILDATNGYAYIQNADTNAYLESQLAAKAPAPIVSQTDITAGSTALATGQDYLVYE